MVVALETLLLLAIVAQNASVPSYCWGSFSSSRSCFHQHRGGWIAISESIISAIDSDCLGCTCLKWGRDRELTALDLGLDLRSAEVAFWAGSKHYLCRRYELLSPAPCQCVCLFGCRSWLRVKFHCAAVVRVMAHRDLRPPEWVNKTPKQCFLPR